MVAGMTLSTMCGMSLLVNLKHRRKLLAGLEWEMVAAPGDSLPFAHQNLKPLTKDVSSSA